MDTLQIDKEGVHMSFEKQRLAVERSIALFKGGFYQSFFSEILNLRKNI